MSRVFALGREVAPCASSRARAGSRSMSRATSASSRRCGGSPRRLASADELVDLRSGFFESRVAQAVAAPGRAGPAGRSRARGDQRAPAPRGTRRGSSSRSLSAERMPSFCGSASIARAQLRLSRARIAGAIREIRQQPQRPRTHRRRCRGGVARQQRFQQRVGAREAAGRAEHLREADRAGRRVAGGKTPRSSPRGLRRHGRLPSLPRHASTLAPASRGAARWRGRGASPRSRKSCRFCRMSACTRSVEALASSCEAHGLSKRLSASEVPRLAVSARPSQIQLRQLGSDRFVLRLARMPLFEHRDRVVARARGHLQHDVVGSGRAKPPDLSRFQQRLARSATPAMSAAILIAAAAQNVASSSASCTNVKPLTCTGVSPSISANVELVYDAMDCDTAVTVTGKMTDVDIPCASTAVTETCAVPDGVFRRRHRDRAAAARSAQSQSVRREAASSRCSTPPR